MEKEEGGNRVTWVERVGMIQGEQQRTWICAKNKTAIVEIFNCVRKRLPAPLAHCLVAAVAGGGSEARKD